MPFDTIISDDENQVITLKDLSDKTSVEIFAFGALLNKFSVWHNEGFLNIVDGFASAGEAKELLTPFFKSAKLSPYACRVNNATYSFGKNEYHLTKYSSHGNALHGLLFNVVFSVKDFSNTENAATVILEHIYDNKNEGYPFRYKCEVKYELSAKNSLVITTTVTNLNDGLMPLVDGWHPYFSLGDTIDDYQVEFQSKEMLEFDENLIPTGKPVPYAGFNSLKAFGPTFLDNCFTVNFAECQPMCVVRNTARKVQLEVHPETSYPYLQIYTPEHRKSIAIENLSGAPDAFNNGIGLKVLEPGEVAVFSTKFIIKSLN